MLKTIELRELPPAVKEWLAALPNNTDILLTNDNQPVVRLTPMTSRKPGQHAGQIWVSEDFDAPLPESFWLTGE